MSISVLVVDDDAREAQSLVREVEELGACEVQHADPAAASALLDRYDLCIIEASLPQSVGLVRRARASSTTPHIVATSRRADRARVAELILAGADAYVEKPLASADLVSVLKGLEDGESACKRMARLLVGRLGMKEAQGHLRAAMTDEALARTGGSRRAAARLLGVTRRYVQLLLEDDAG